MQTAGESGWKEGRLAERQADGVGEAGGCNERRTAGGECSQYSMTLLFGSPSEPISGRLSLSEMSSKQRSIIRWNGEREEGTGASGTALAVALTAVAGLARVEEWAVVTRWPAANFLRALHFAALLREANGASFGLLEAD